jgi:hypothetical protein
MGLNLTKFNYLFPSHLDVRNEVISNNCLTHFGLMPLFKVEHPIILFKPNCPNGNAMENVVNLDSFIKFLRSAFP